MLIRDMLNPIDGIFSAMPQDIWNGDLDPSSLDIELWTRIGGLDAAPLFKFFVNNDTLDVDGLAKLLYSRYHNNWQKMWNALIADYDVLLTSSMEETRTVERNSDSTETRDLTDLEDTSVSAQETGTNSNNRTGSVSRDESQQTSYGTTVAHDATRTNKDTESGNELVTETTADNLDGTERLVKSGAESTATDSTETRNLTGTETGLVSKATTEGGTVANDGTETGTVGTGVSETGTVRKAGTETGSVGTDVSETGTVGTTGTERGTIGTDTVESGTVRKAGTDRGTVGTDVSETGTIGKQRQETGTVGTDVSETGTSSATNEKGVYGVGGSGLVPQSRDVDSNTRDLSTDTTETRNLDIDDDETRNLSTDTNEVRNLSSSDDETRNLSTDVNESRNLTNNGTETRNLSTDTTETRSLASSDNETRNLSTDTTETRNLTTGSTETRNLEGTEDENRNLTTRDTGSVSTDGTSVLSFNGRTDAVTKAEERNGTSNGNTSFGKVLDTTGKETEKTSKSGSDSVDGGSIETYNNLRDTGDISRDVNENTNGTKKQTGTVGNVGNELQTETFSSVGSTPLHPYQDLITMEVEGRSGQGWNFTDRVILDVQAMIALKIWKRGCNDTL